MCDSSDTPTRNIKFVIAYNGAAYHGWQKQALGVLTVQETIETIATRVMGHRIVLHGAGRTDAGVHADGQTANFHTPNMAIPLLGLRRAINSKLPGDITIRSASLVPDEFQASRSATGKTYRYRIYVAPARPVSLNKQVYYYAFHPLDVGLMQDAAERLIGTHDFAGFATSADKRKSSVRTIFRCEVAEAGPEIHVTVQGNGFLYNMVRNIVGTLMEIGRSHFPPERINLVLASKNRADAGPTAPPDGLSMVCVHYE